MIKSVAIKPITKKAIREMRSILRKFETGKVPQDQAFYFCGTARCMAGEKFVEDLARHYKDKSIISKEIYVHDYHLFTVEVADPMPIITERAKKDKEFEKQLDYSVRIYGDYAQSAWGLNHTEATELFEGDATLERQTEVVEKLSQGLRLYKDGWGWNNQFWMTQEEYRLKMEGQ